MFGYVVLKLRKIGQGWEEGPDKGQSEQRALRWIYGNVANAAAEARLLFRLLDMEAPCLA